MSRLPEEENETPAERTDRIWRELVLTAAELVVNLGLMSSVMGQYPEHVREGLDERMTHMVGVMEQEIIAVQDFGEAYDE